MNLQKFSRLVVLIFLKLSLFFSLALVCQTAQASIIFEGYYKLTLQNSHIGYIILQYQFDESKNQFKSNSLVVTNETAGSLQESVQGVAASDLTPISYKYISASKDENKKLQIKVILADFKKLSDGKFTMTGTMKSSAGTQKLNQTYNKGVFLSSFLTFVMLQNKYEEPQPNGTKKLVSGIVTGKNYVYKAIAEEDGAANDGEAFVESQKDYKGLKVFIIKNKFKGSDFVNYVTAMGESVLTQTPLQGLNAELVDQPKLATDGISFNESAVRTVFGTIPEGRENSLYRKISKLSNAVSPSTSSTTSPSTNAPTSATNGSIENTPNGKKATK